METLLASHCRRHTHTPPPQEDSPAGPPETLSPRERRSVRPCVSGGRAGVPRQLMVMVVGGPGGLEQKNVFLFLRRDSQNYRFVKGSCQMDTNYSGCDPFIFGVVGGAKDRQFTQELKTCFAEKPLKSTLSKKNESVR